ncbi:hypothetical protein [Daejeonella sp.]|uniref:hypothetical protein n=1 Tax=Daejeonella sp. TaxID=2805397 RepID=UPI0030C03F29
MSNFETPDQLRNIYIHKANKDYAIAITSKSPANEIEYQCLISNNGFEGTPSLTGIFSTELMPKPIGSIYAAAVNLSNYLRKNGYKECNTIIQTKNGVKPR